MGKECRSESQTDATLIGLELTEVSILQVHKEGSKFQFFSRNGFDFTGDFGSSPREAPGKFCCHLADCLAPSVRSVILDGEICAYNHVTGSLCQKGE